MYDYKASLLRVVDGDTLDLEIDLGLEAFRHLRVRLAGIDAPELSTPEGKVAKRFLAALFSVDYRDATFIVHTIKDRQEKYGRYLAWVELPDGSFLHECMIAAGHAVPYEGGKR